MIQQAANKLTTVAPELALNVGFVQAGRNDVNAPIVVGSVQTLAVASRLAQLPQIFDTVIVDEAHHAAADSYQRILAHVAGSAMIVGFTATPERADKKDLRNAFDSLAYARSVEEMIREGYLCDLRALRVKLEQLDLKKVKKTGGMSSPRISSMRGGSGRWRSSRRSHCRSRQRRRSARPACARRIWTVRRRRTSGGR